MLDIAASPDNCQVSDQQWVVLSQPIGTESPSRPGSHGAPTAPLGGLDDHRRSA